MDAAKGRDIAYVQFLQNFDNATKNDLSANSFDIINEMGVEINTSKSISLFTSYADFLSSVYKD